MEVYKIMNSAGESEYLSLKILGKSIDADR